jgi:hypothetical protein
MAEYVLVLAGNKKDKAQMKKELQLFLGKNTGCFVDWLVSLLVIYGKHIVFLGFLPPLNEFKKH